MPSTETNEDLSSDTQLSGQSVSTSTSARPQAVDQTIPVDRVNVRLEEQLLFQRRLVFGATVTVCGLMFIAFGVSFFWSHFFRVLIVAHSYAAVLAMALLIIPSFLLWGLIRAVYKVGADSGNIPEVVIKEIHKVHPIT